MELKKVTLQMYESKRKNRNEKEELKNFDSTKRLDCSCLYTIFLISGQISIVSY